jgi:sensor domain CHASE-containing protein
MLKVPWTDKITNENIVKQINEKIKTIKELRKRQDLSGTFKEKES